MAQHDYTRDCGPLDHHGQNDIRPHKNIRVSIMHHTPLGEGRWAKLSITLSGMARMCQAQNSLKYCAIVTASTLPSAYNASMILCTSAASKRMIYAPVVGICDITSILRTKKEIGPVGIVARTLYAYRMRPYGRGSIDRE